MYIKSFFFRKNRFVATVHSLCTIEIRMKRCQKNTVFLYQNHLKMATQDLAAVPTEAMTIDEIKNLYPDEWVLIGNPVMDEGFLHVLSGIPVIHSRDKREVAYFGREKAKNYQTVTLIYTGTFKPARKITTLFSRPNYDFPV